MRDNNIYKFLESFFALFKAHIEEFELENNKVSGSLGWKSELEKQSFVWITELDESVLIKLKLLCEYLIEHDFNQGDKIILSEAKLESNLAELGWNLNEAKKIIDLLCDIEIKMIDDGEETDSFFLHF